MSGVEFILERTDAQLEDGGWKGRGKLKERAEEVRAEQQLRRYKRGGRTRIPDVMNAGFSLGRELVELQRSM